MNRDERRVLEITLSLCRSGVFGGRRRMPFADGFRVGVGVRSGDSFTKFSGLRNFGADDKNLKYLL